MVSEFLMMNEELKESKAKPDGSTRNLLFLIIVVALLARVYICYFSGLPAYSTDTYAYFEMADGIIKGSPLSSFPNGYPLIIALVKNLVGDAFLPSALILLNLVFSTLVVLMTYFIARTILDWKFSLCATALVALWPSQLNYARLLLSEVPATFFLILGIFILTRSRKSVAAISGVMFFFAGMIRSTLSPVGFLASAYLFVVGERRKAILLVAGVLFGMFAAGILYRTGVILPSSNLGANLLISLGSSTHGLDFSLSQFSEREIAAPLLTYLKFAVENPSIFLQQRFASFWVAPG